MTCPPRKFVRYIYDFEIELDAPAEAVEVGPESGEVGYLALSTITTADINRIREVLNAALSSISAVRFTGNHELRGPRLFDDHGDIAATTLPPASYGHGPTD
jgi:hypothetical protein